MWSKPKFKKRQFSKRVSLYTFLSIFPTLSALTTTKLVNSLKKKKKRGSDLLSQETLPEHAQEQNMWVFDSPERSKEISTVTFYKVISPWYSEWFWDSCLLKLSDLRDHNNCKKKLTLSNSSLNKSESSLSMPLCLTTWNRSRKFFKPVMQSSILSSKCPNYSAPFLNVLYLV